MLTIETTLAVNKQYVALTDLAFHRMTHCDVSLHRKRQCQPDSGVADRVRERAPQLQAVALERHAVFDGRVMIQGHCEREDEIEKSKT